MDNPVKIITITIGIKNTNIISFNVDKYSFIIIIPKVTNINPIPIKNIINKVSNK